MSIFDKRKASSKKRIPPLDIISVKVAIRIAGLPYGKHRPACVMSRIRQEVLYEHRRLFE